MNYKHINVLRDGKAFTVSLTDTTDMPEVMSELSDFYMNSCFLSGTEVIVKLDTIAFGVVQDSVSSSVRSVLLSDGNLIECNVMKLSDAHEGLFTDGFIVYTKQNKSDLYFPVACTSGAPLIGYQAPKFLTEEEVEVWPPTTKEANHDNSAE